MASIIQRPGGIKLHIKASNAAQWPAPTVQPQSVDVSWKYADETIEPRQLGTFPVGGKIQIPLATDLDRDINVYAIARGPLGQQHVTDWRDAPRLTVESEREQRKPIIGQMGTSTHQTAIIGVSHFPRSMHTRRIELASDFAFTTIIATWYEDIDRIGLETPRLPEQFSINRTVFGISALTVFIRVSQTAFSTSNADQTLTYQQQLESLRWGPNSDVLPVTLADLGETGGSTGNFNPFVATFQGYGGSYTDYAFSVPMPGDPASGAVTGSSGGFDDRLAIWNHGGALGYIVPIYVDRVKSRILTNGYVLPSGIAILGGTGSPEGVAGNEAPVGSHYYRDDATEYRKATGVGNTGWVLVTGGGHSLKNQSTAVATRPAISNQTYSPLQWVDDAANFQTVLEAPGVESAVRNLVTWFGADPLGVVDITAALTAAVATKGRIVLARGTYRLDSTFVLPNSHEYDDFIIEGQGMGSTEIKFYGTGNAFEQANGALDNCQFRNFRLVNMNPANTGDGFHFYGDATSVNTGIEFYRVAAWNFGGYGFNFDNIQSSVIRDCESRGHKSGHIKFFDSDNISALKEPNSNIIWHCKLDNLTVDDANEASIYLFHSNGVIIGGQTTIQGNFAGTGGNVHAIYAENCDSLQFQGVWVEDLSSGGSAVYLKGCRAFDLGGYHGSGQYPVDFVFDNCRSGEIHGATLTNDVLHFQNINSFDIIARNSVFSNPGNVFGSDTSGHILIDQSCHYHNLPDNNYRSYQGTESLFTGWGENLIPNPNIVDDTVNWTFDAGYVSRVATGSPSGVGGYWLFDPGAVDGSAFVTGQILEQTLTIPDSVVANFYTLTYDVYFESKGAANNINRFVGLALVTTGQGEFTTQYKNQIYNNLPLNTWIRQSLAVYLKPTTSRTVRFRIDPNQTTKGPDTPRIRFANFRFAQGRAGQPGGATYLTEEKTGVVRAPDGLRLASRPSAAAPPATEGGFRYNAGAYETYDHTTSQWITAGARSIVINAGAAPYLALATGVDTTAAIQAALDDAAAGLALAVFLPAGSYYAPGGLTVTGSIEFFGAGVGQTIIHSDANVPIVTLAGDAITFLGPRHNGMTIRGSKAAGTSQIGVKLDASPYMHACTVDHLMIEKTGGSGLYVGNVFSSTFDTIFVDDCEGWLFDYNAAYMPTNRFVECYPGNVSLSHPAGFRIRSGNFFAQSCNGINNSPVGSWVAIIGRKNGLYGETTNGNAMAHWLDCGFESPHTGLVQHLQGSYSIFSGRCNFSVQRVQSTIASGGIDNTQTSIPVAGNMDTLGFLASGELMVIEGANVEFMQVSSRTVNVATVTRGTPAFSFSAAAVVVSRHAIGLLYDVAIAGAFPAYFNKGIIADTCTVDDGPESYYKKGSFIHCDELPPIKIEGEGPGTGGTARPVWSYYNTTRSRVEPLVRVDGNYARVVVTGTTSYPNPGASYFACRLSAPSTLTLHWPGYQWHGKPVVVADELGNAATNPITINAASGATIAGGSSFVIDRNFGSVTLLPSTSPDGGQYWEIIGSYPTVSGAGTTNKLAAWTSATGLSDSPVTMSGSNITVAGTITTTTDINGGAFNATGISLYPASGNPNLSFSAGGADGRFQVINASYLQLGTTTNHDVRFLRNGANAWTLSSTGLIPMTTQDLGSSGNPVQDVFVSSFVSMKETTAPTTPPANTAYFYAKDKAGVSALYYKDDGGTEHDLSATGGGGGAAIDSGVYASRPTGAEDDVYISTDGELFSRKNASAWEDYGPIWKLTPPPVHSNWTDINSGAGTFEDQPGALHLQVPFAADQLRGMDKAAPGGDYTITALVEIQFSAQNYQQAGIMFADNSGKYETLEIAYITDAWRMRVSRWNSATAGTTGVKDVAFYNPCRIWLRMRDDSATNRIYSWSTDGKNFIQLHAEGRTNHLTATRVGIFANGGGSTQPIDVRLLSWTIT